MQDTITTLRHETLAHFVLNLFGSLGKAVLPADIIAAKKNPVIGKIGDDDLTITIKTVSRL